MTSELVKYYQDAINSGCVDAEQVQTLSAICLARYELDRRMDNLLRTIKESVDDEQ